MEGIETIVMISPLKSGVNVSRCPDMEGIETLHLSCNGLPIVVSVGAPTWRGLKPSGVDVSLCRIPPMSVGAPTWRGLKQRLPTHVCTIHMSVGAPTWRGLKLRTIRVQQTNPHVSRCPDMEGIETRGRLSGSLVHMSVGAPTWRGLKPSLWRIQPSWVECQ